MPSVAASRTTIHRLLPVSPSKSQESIHSGAWLGLSLRQKEWPVTPSGKTWVESGRSRRYGSR